MGRAYLAATMATQTVTEIRLIDREQLLLVADQLFREHWQEIALHRDLMVLKPNLEAYRLAADRGSLFVLGAFADGELVGYSVNFLLQHLHYADLTYVMNDLLFVTASHRRGSLGRRLIDETERAAKQLGAKMMVWHAKQGTTLEAMLPRLGYGVQDVLFSREI